MTRIEQEQRIWRSRNVNAVRMLQRMHFGEGNAWESPDDLAPEATPHIYYGSNETNNQATSDPETDGPDPGAA